MPRQSKAQRKTTGNVVHAFGSRAGAGGKSRSPRKTSAPGMQKAGASAGRKKSLTQQTKRQRG